MSLLGTAKSLLHAHPGQGDRQGTDRILASMAYPKRKMTGPYGEGVGGSRDCKARMLRAHSHTQTVAGCCPQARDATEGKVAKHRPGAPSAPKRPPSASPSQKAPSGSLPNFMGTATQVAENGVQL